MTHSHLPLKTGSVFSFRKTMTVAEQAMFTGISGNLGGLYVDAIRAKKAGASNMVAFELAVGGLATTCLSQLGGPTRRIGSIALSFAAPVIVGDSVEAKAEIISVDGDDAVCRITCTRLDSGEASSRTAMRCRSAGAEPCTSPNHSTTSRWATGSASARPSPSRRFYIAAWRFRSVHVGGLCRRNALRPRLAPGIMVAGLCTSVLTSELVGTIGVSRIVSGSRAGVLAHHHLRVWIAEQLTDPPSSGGGARNGSYRGLKGARRRNSRAADRHEPPRRDGLHPYRAGRHRPGARAAFNVWYQGTHFPELLAIPGCRQS